MTLSILKHQNLYHRPKELRWFSAKLASLSKDHAMRIYSTHYWNNYDESTVPGISATVSKHHMLIPRKSPFSPGSLSVLLTLWIRQAYFYSYQNLYSLIHENPKKPASCHFAWHLSSALFAFQTLKTVQCALNYRC